MNELELWNVDQPVKMSIVAHKQFVFQTITLPNVNVQLVLGLEIHIIRQVVAQAFHAYIISIAHQHNYVID